MDDLQPDRRFFDIEQYTRRTREGPCFICAFVREVPGYRHHTVYEDETTIAFLNRYPTLLGYCLLAPIRHVEDWVHGLEESEFLNLQRLVRRVAQAISATVPTERMYTLSLGSQKGNAHVHWHIAPLPPGVPYERQQFHALMAEHGVLDIEDAAQAALARTIARRL